MVALIYAIEMYLFLLILVAIGHLVVNKIQQQENWANYMFIKRKMEFADEVKRAGFLLQLHEQKKPKKKNQKIKFTGYFSGDLVESFLLTPQND